MNIKEYIDVLFYIFKSVLELENKIEDMFTSTFPIYGALSTVATILAVLKFIEKLDKKNSILK